MTDLPPKGSSLTILQQYVHDMVIERGFDDETLAQRFMLLLEEAGEFAKAGRKAAGMKMATDAAQLNMAHEAADVLIVLLDICTMLGIDLDDAFHAKETKNAERNWQ